MFLTMIHFNLSIYAGHADAHAKLHLCWYTFNTIKLDNIKHTNIQTKLSVQHRSNRIATQTLDIDFAWALLQNVAAAYS